MPEAGAQPEVPAPTSRWREAADRLRSTARVFVASLGAVAVTVVAGLSLTGLSTLDPNSTNFGCAVTGALLALVGVVVMLALVLRLASTSALSMSELLNAGGWRRRGYIYAKNIVGDKSNGYLAGYDGLEQFSQAVAAVHEDERKKAEASAAAPGNKDAFQAYKAARLFSDWHDARLGSLIAAASFQRLRWNFGKTALLMAGAGLVSAVGIVMYAAASQQRDVPSSPVAVTTHESIDISAPDEAAAAALYEAVVGCNESVQALVIGVREASVSAITIPNSECRSVTMDAVWDDDKGYVADFNLPEETETP